MTLIDCDIHPGPPSTDDLAPYLDGYWREMAEIGGVDDLTLATYKASLPRTMRKDWRAAMGDKVTLPGLQEHLLDPYGVEMAICNVVHAASSLNNQYFAAAMCKATNDWLAREWLDRDARLRASIVVPVQEPTLAVEEIERIAAIDPRFVQVLLPVAGDMPFGRRFFWPIYEAAQRHSLAVAIHPGGGVRFPHSYVGWHSYFAEDDYLQSGILQGQLLSLLHEGVFAEFPDLTIVILESGLSWLMPFLTDADNKWMALRREVPWIEELPSEIIRRRCRFSVQPFHAPPEAAAEVLRMLGHEEMFLMATDFPHWQFDGTDPYPAGFSGGLRDRIAAENPLRTYPRLAREA